MNPRHHCFQLGDIQTNRGQTGPLDHIQRGLDQSLLDQPFTRSSWSITGMPNAQILMNIRKKTNYWRTRQPAFLSEYLLLLDDCSV